MTGNSEVARPQIVVDIRPSHTLSVPHKMISESPACLNCPNGVRGSLAGRLVKSTYVKLTGNALRADVAPKARVRHTSTRRRLFVQVESHPLEISKHYGAGRLRAVVWITY